MIFDSFDRSSRIVWLSFTFALVFPGACTDAQFGDAGPGQGQNPIPCTTDSDCESGATCIGNICEIGMLPIDDDAGSGNGSSADGGGSSDGHFDGGTDGGSEPKAILSAQPTGLIEFGAQRLGIPVNRSLQLVNIGDAPLTLIQVVLDDNDTGEFTAAPLGSLNEVLDPQDAITIELTHLPVDGQPDAAALKVVHTADTEGFFEVDLVAEFKGEAETSISTSMDALTTDLIEYDFGLIPLSANQSATFFIRNGGASDSVLTLNDVTLTPEGGGFSVPSSLNLPAFLSSYAGNCPGGLADCPGASAACVDAICVDENGAPVDTVTLEVDFSPPAVGAHSAILTLAHAGSGDVVQTELSLKGEGVTGDLQVSPGAIDFQEIFVGEYRQQTVTIANVGGANAVVSNIHFADGADFGISIGDSLPATLAPGAETQVTIIYQPATEGAFTDQLHIEHPLGDDILVDISASARFAPSILVEPSVDPSDESLYLDFGGIYVGITQTVELPIRNMGPGILHIADLRLEGANVDKFSLSPPDFPDPLQPLADSADTDPRLLLQIKYTPELPLSAFEDTATLFIESDDPENPEVEITLKGIGIQPQLVLSSAELNFGEVEVNSTSASQTIEIRNNGAGPLIVSSILLDAGSVFSFSTVPPLPAELSSDFPLASIDLIVEFTPTAPTLFTDSLTLITNDAAVETTGVVSLLGSGKPCDAVPGTSYVQDGAACTYSCVPDYWDLDGDLNTAGSNGCEYACVFQSSSDLPDDAFVDANCDGIDGDLTQAIFVAPDGDDANTGALDAPKATLQNALLATNAMQNALYVSQGTYDGPITIQNGISVYGAYDAADGWSRAADHVTTILGVDGNAVDIVDIDETTVLDRLQILAGNAVTPAANSTGIYIRNASSDLEIRNCTIIAGNGANGIHGTSGTNGAAGGNGNGGTGGCDGCSGDGQGGTGGSTTCGAAGGDGKRGGHDNSNGTNGESGQNASNNGGAGGGGADVCNSSWCSSCGGQKGGIEGTDGTIGADGTKGDDGEAGNGNGTIASNRWAGSDGNNGSDGTAGIGGGGGGGGGGGADDCYTNLYWCFEDFGLDPCYSDRGGGGGGGGAGGCKGTAGTGGQGGGGSFGIFLRNASPTLSNNTITAGNGGNGGEGASGGDGGTKGGLGSGGGKADDGAKGGDGAEGGQGGDGGGGGGGGGGISYCIYRSGSSSLSLTNITYNLGGGGNGGKGGSTILSNGWPINSGQNGNDGSLY